MPARRNSSSPEPSVNVSASKIRSCGLHAVLMHGNVMDPAGDSDLPVGCLGHPFFIDGQCDDRRAVGPAQGEDRLDPFFAVFEVDGIDDGLASDQLQGFFDHRRFRRIDHHRQRDLCIEPEEDLPHILLLIASHIGSADIHHVRSLLHRFLPHGHDAFPVFLREEFPELLAAVGIRPFADQHGWRIEVQRGVLIETRRARDELRCAAHRGKAAHRLHELPDVFGCRAAASTHDTHAKVLDKMCQVLREVCRRQVIMRMPADILRNAGIRHHEERFRAGRGERADVLGHLHRPGGAVHADDVDVVWLQRHQGRA